MAAVSTEACEVCNFPTFVQKGKEGPVICSMCSMIANGETYADGSDPATRFSPETVARIKSSYFELKHALL